VSIFKEEVIKSIIDKAKKDKTGRVGESIKQVMDICKRAGEVGLTLEELSIIATSGWYISQDPMMAELMKNMINMPPPPDDEEFLN